MQNELRTIASMATRSNYCMLVTVNRDKVAIVSQKPHNIPVTNKGTPLWFGYVLSVAGSCQVPLPCGGAQAGAAWTDDELLPEALLAKGRVHGATAHIQQPSMECTKTCKVTVAEFRAMPGWLKFIFQWISPFSIPAWQLQN